MKKTKFKSPATVVAQFAADQEYDAVIVDGNLFLPVVIGIAGMFEGSSPVQTEKTVATAPSKSAPVAEQAKPVASGKIYSEKELMEIDSPKLEKMCADMGITIPKEGRNTNKKLRDLILDAQEDGATSAPAVEAEEEETPPVRSTKKVDSSEIFAGLEDSSLTEPKAIAKLVELGMDKADASEIVDDFMSKPDEPVETFVNKANGMLNGSAKEEKAAPVKRGAEAKPKNVAIKDLQVDDKVNVFWADQDSYYTGVIAEVSRKGTLVAYDDGTEEYLDPENNTEITVL